MRRGLALASDYARKRVAFGAPLSEKPLHRDTLAVLEAETEAAFHLAFYVAELTGRSETGEISDRRCVVAARAYAGDEVNDRQAVGDGRE